MPLIECFSVSLKKKKLFKLDPQMEGLRFFLVLLCVVL